MNSSFYPLVMGIVNVNNESFYESSRVTRCSDFLQRIDSMINSGAKIIDIGGCSTRPGSIPVSLEQEWEYIEEPLLMLKGRDLKGVLISIDTFRSDIVKRAHKVIGNFIVNDISAGEDDNLMLQTIGELGLTYIAMHKRGTPSTMVNLCDYPNGVTNEIIDYFTLFHKKAMRFGIKNYIIDPGLGFAKTIEQNYELLKNTGYIKQKLMEVYPDTRILIGLSRKGMIWRYLGITPQEALPATSALNLHALTLGADIIRVHDVNEGMQCIKMLEQLV